MSKMISRSVVPISTSTSPVFFTWPVRAKILVPLLLSVPLRREPGRPVEDDPGDVRPGLDVVEGGRLIEIAAFDRVDVLGPGLADLALERGHQRRRLAADEGPAAAGHLDVEAEAGPQDVLAQQAELPRLLDGLAGVHHRQGILVADVHVALARADGVRADHHPLEDRVGIALQQPAVHVGAGVALVGVADDVALVAGGAPALLPLAGGRVPAAAAPPQTGRS